MDLEAKKRFVVKNSHVLDFATQKSIYNLIVNSEETESILQNPTNKKYSINLDLIENPIIINNIYHIIKTRVEVLKSPILN
uniref:Uncharacterized protein n=1 Tax=Abalone asfa-like virus TaxID=2839893 RepID=A0A5K7XX97_9VIRU|nr:hypothetical protein [Abalone asfa-like virus]